MFDMGKFSGTKELIQADLTAMSYPIISRQTDVVVPVLGVGRGWAGTAMGQEGDSCFSPTPSSGGLGFAENGPSCAGLHVGEPG